jgi:hypothetical protein
VYVLFEPDRTPSRFARRWIGQSRGDFNVIVAAVLSYAEQNVVVFVVIVEEWLGCLIWSDGLFCRSWYHDMNHVFD